MQQVEKKIETSSGATVVLPLQQAPEQEPEPQIPVLKGTAPRTLLNQVRLEFSKIVGPIGRVVFEKAIKNSGFTTEEFPFSRLPALVDELAAKIGPAERRAFKKKIQNLIHAGF